MSVYTQEVLGLLRRNKKKKKLDKIRDHFEFGKLYQNSTLNTGAAYNPTMEPFVIKWGDFKCATEEGMVRQDPTGTEERYITMWTDPVFQGECQTATITKTIISQNAIGDTINIAGDLYVDGTITTPTLTEDRIVIVGPGGVLEDDGNFTMDGVTFTALVNVQHGSVVASPGVPTTTTTLNSNIILNGPITDSQGNLGGLSQVLVGLADGRVVWSDDDVVEALTYGSLWQGNSNNLKQELAIGTADQILISDGTTFSWEDNPAAIVGEVCTVNTIPLWTPDSNTLGCSKLFQDGNNATPATNVTSSVTFNVVNTTSSIINVGNVAFNGTNRFNFIGFNNFSSGLSSTTNGNTIVSSFYTSTVIDAYNNYIEMYYSSGTDTNKLTIGGNSSEVVHPGLVKGSVQILPDLELEKVDDNNTLDKVLVRDVTTGIIKQRDASTIKPQVGFDTLAMTPDGWASADGNFNAFVNLDDTTTAVKSIKDMTWLVDGDRVVVIAENVKTGSALADNAIQFPDWVNGGVTTNNFSSWDAGPNSGYPTSTLLFGEKLKFRAELYQQSATINQLNWDACCKITANNGCPVATSDSYTIDEDSGTLTATAQVIDDGYGSYGLTYTALTQPGNGTFTFDTATGAWTYTPNANYFGVEQFTFKAFDGYCDSNVATITINVIAVDDSPEWTSTNPVSANTYPNLTAGDQWDYNWTTADPDTPCADLTYVITVTDVTTSTVYTLPDANQWLTFTPDGANNCAGTLSGQYPATGGAWTVNMTVSDNSNPTPLSDTDNFTIAGIVPTINTYFVNWFDASGSLNGAGSVLSQASSIGYVRAVNATTVNGNSVTLQNGNAEGPTLNGEFNNDMVDITNTYRPLNSQYLIVDGMELFVMNQTTGVETTTGAFVINQPVGVIGNNIINLDANVTLTQFSALVFRRTAAQKKADYNGGSVANTRLTMRSFLQDFYATGLTEAQEDAAFIANNPATNGSDQYDLKVKFGWRGGQAAEHQISFLSNCNNGPLLTGAGEMFENADTVTFMAWGDESNDYMDTLSYTDRSVGTTPTGPTDGLGGPLIVSDVQTVQNYITAAETATGSNQIWKGISFNLLGGPSTANLVQAMVIGINATPNANLSSSGSAFSGNWTNADLMPVVNNTAPIKFTAAGYTGDPTQTPTPLTNTVNSGSTLFAGQAATQANVTANGQYYMGIARNRLLALGFVGI